MSDNNLSDKELRVSVIIPAYNAEHTLSETIEAVLNQTHPYWEAIIIDDGSEDRTLDIIRQFSKRDSRIRFISQSNKGEAATRNSGLELARFDWLLFLDSDDWILPNHLQRMTAGLSADSTLDAILCGWNRVALDGTLVAEYSLPTSSDLFKILALQPLFPVHACIVRRNLVHEVGGFDTSFRTSPDWDLWQRICRTGVLFGIVNEVLALYRMRPNSASLNAVQLLKDGLRIINQGHSPDPRVPNPHPKHANGLPPIKLSGQKYYLLCWCAGQLIGQNEDPIDLFDLLIDNFHGSLDPNGVAHNIFQSVPFSKCLSTTEWINLWHKVNPLLSKFLHALESRTQTSDLAFKSMRFLERMILEMYPGLWPMTLGSTHAVKIEISKQVNNITLTIPAKELYCITEILGYRSRGIVLPINDMTVPSSKIYATIKGKSLDIIKPQNKSSHLDRSDLIYLEHSILENSSFARPFTLCINHSKTIDITKPIPDITTPDGVERLHCIIEAEGDYIGSIELPVCNGFVPSKVISDKIAFDLGWQILRLHFRNVVYDRLSIEKSSKGYKIFRDDLLLAEMQPDMEKFFWDDIHDVIGWTVFLQEIWDRPQWSLEQFYNRGIFEKNSSKCFAEKGCFSIEVSEDLPDIAFIGPQLDLALKVGGVPIGVVAIPFRRNVISAQIIRAAVSKEVGYELCNSVVREALIGHPLYEPKSLRTRLAEASRVSQKYSDNTTTESGKTGVVLGRREKHDFGTSVSRYAALPSDAIHDLVESAIVANEPVIQKTDNINAKTRLVYDPGMILPKAKREDQFSTSISVFRSIRRNYDRFSYKIEKRLNNRYLKTLIPHQSHFADKLAILRYNRVAPETITKADSHAVLLSIFEEQLRFIRESGYYSTNLKEWQSAILSKTPLPGKPVLITFDEAYRDFLTSAFPLLKKYGFSAALFLVTDKIKTENNYEAANVDYNHYLSCTDIQHLVRNNMDIGSLSDTNRPLVSLSPVEIVREAARSRATLMRITRKSTTSFAYPHGIEDRVIQHLIGACGYTTGLTTKPAHSTLGDSPLALPRIEISGEDTLEDFINKVSCQRN